MSKEVKKYPVNYALMPLRVDVEISKDLRYYYIAGYIVSKVEVKEEKTIHNEDGSTSYEYQVIYPHRIQINENEFDPNKTTIQILDEEMSMRTFQLFETYELARFNREKKNLSYPEIYDYLHIEDELLDYTSNLLTEEDKRKKEISILERLMGTKEKVKSKRHK